MKDSCRTVGAHLAQVPPGRGVPAHPTRLALRPSGRARVQCRLSVIRKSSGESHGEPAGMQAAGMAVTSIVRIMMGQNAPASTKLRVADMVLTHGAKAMPPL